MNRNKLNILWTNDNELTSELMVMMYATNSLKKEFWKEVRVIIWGATSKLVAQNKHIQDLIKEAKEAGVEFSACEACATELGVKDIIINLGIEVKFWGEPLTKLIKEKENLITI